MGSYEHEVEDSDHPTVDQVEKRAANPSPRHVGDRVFDDRMTDRAKSVCFASHRAAPFGLAKGVLTNKP